MEQVQSKIPETGIDTWVKLEELTRALSYLMFEFNPLTGNEVCLEVVSGDVVNQFFGDTPRHCIDQAYEAHQYEINLWRQMQNEPKETYFDGRQSDRPESDQENTRDSEGT